MKYFVQVTFFSLICSVSLVSLAYAQDDVASDVSVDPVANGEDDVSVTDGEDVAGHVAKVKSEGKVSSIKMIDEDRVLTLDEAKALIDESPAAADAEKGVVELSFDNSFYDIYSRSLSYREGAKELRASLDNRRDDFEEPRVEVIEAYRKKQEKVYEAEMVAFKVAEEEKLPVVSSPDAMADGHHFDISPVLPEDSASDDEVVSDEGSEYSGGLSEKPIPPKEGEEDFPKRKVITSEDAPDFDASRL